MHCISFIITHLMRFSFKSNDNLYSHVVEMFHITKFQQSSLQYCKDVSSLFRNCTSVWCQEVSQSSSGHWYLTQFQHDSEKEFWDQTCYSCLCRLKMALYMKINLLSIKKWVSFAIPSNRFIVIFNFIKQGKSDSVITRRLEFQWLTGCFHVWFVTSFQGMDSDETNLISCLNKKSHRRFGIFNRSTT
jgi:hypothetical protein